MVENFKEDITEHDKLLLTGYEGDFISLYRESGTHLFRCDTLKDLANWNYKNIPESIQLSYEGLLAMVKMNQNYIYVKDDTFKPITAAEVEAIMSQKHKDALYFYENSFKKMNFDGMAATIEFFMVQYGRKWKSNFVKEWEGSYCSPETQRIRNHFGMDFLKTIKFQTKQEEIRKSLINFYMKDR
ncbi:hypothetical protein [Sulfurimonas sp. NW9]|uniref:hypothetical protein n=1 Tax=Sulfurimonas sp. NW9 TaxID=2922728 RepID=UPI003DA8B523